MIMRSAGHGSFGLVSAVWNIYLVESEQGYMKTPKKSLYGIHLLWPYQQH